MRKHVLTLAFAAALVAPLCSGASAQAASAGAGSCVSQATWNIWYPDATVDYWDSICTSSAAYAALNQVAPNGQTTFKVAALDCTAATLTGPTGSGVLVQPSNNNSYRDNAGDITLSFGKVVGDFHATDHEDVISNNDLCQPNGYDFLYGVSTFQFENA